MNTQTQKETGEGNAPRLIRTPWRQVSRDRLESEWNGLAVTISRVLSHNDRPTNRWNAYVSGQQVGRWGGSIKQCVQSIAKHIRENNLRASELSIQTSIEG